MEGIPEFSLLPKGSTLWFPSGAVLLVEEYNPPCGDMGAQIAAKYASHSSELLTDQSWLRPAAGRRGLVGVVGVAGEIHVGDELAENNRRTTSNTKLNRYNSTIINEVSGVGEGDIASYREYLRLMQRFADALEPFWLKTIPRIGFNSLADVMTLGRMGLSVRMLGKTDMREFLRIAALPTRDLMDENFDHDVLKALLCNAV